MSSLGRWLKLPLASLLKINQQRIHFAYSQHCTRHMGQKSEVKTRLEMNTMKRPCEHAARCTGPELEQVTHQKSAS